MADLNTVLSSASAAQAAGRPEECLALCEELLAIDPQNLQAMLLKGVALAKSGKALEAIPVLKQAWAADPQSFQAPFWLSVAYRKAGDLRSATRAAEGAIAIKPNDPQGQAQLGACYLDERRLPLAETWFRNAAGGAEGALEIQASLSHAIARQGRVNEALSLLRSALDHIRPSDQQLLMTASSLLTQDFALGAEEAARRVVESDLRSVPAQLVLGRALSERNANLAVKHLQAALDLEPTNSDAEALLGAALQTIGAFNEAAVHFRSSIEAQPRQGFAYYSKCNNGIICEQDQQMVDTMRALTEEELSPRHKSYLHYGLGKAYEDLGDYPSAMLHYDEANRMERKLKLRGRPMDRLEFAGRTEWISATFAKEVIGLNAAKGSGSDLPVFVVGMMRSGTTLVEQILASHAQIGAVGEHPFWNDNWRDAMTDEGSRVDADGLESLAERYCSVLQAISPGNRRVVGKVLGVGFGLGVIHLSLPMARIIHVRRDPLDTCLSIYTTPNRMRLEYTHDQENIEFAYQQYLAAMAHWRSVLPQERLLEIDYEVLVSDPGPTIRRMIRFCDVEWSESCLRPEENPRRILAPNSWSIRQPIYSTSVKRSQRFDPWVRSYQKPSKC